MITAAYYTLVILWYAGSAALVVWFLYAVFKPRKRNRYVIRQAPKPDDRSSLEIHRRIMGGK